MVTINDNITDKGIELVTPFGKREITHVFHDIDGTHSLIREWQPVMSLVLCYAITYGLPENFDSDENIQKLIGRVGELRSDETDSFCIESAGLSALTQMEWAIRRAVQEDSINAGLTESESEVNARIIKDIWGGKEIFDDENEPKTFLNYLSEMTPRLFKMYEKILNGACRDRNLKIALQNPDKMRVKGSYEFVKFLNGMGVKNYLVTGAVISYDENGKPFGGMYEEITSLGFKIEPNGDFESIEGSTWDNKIPKNEVMQRLCEKLRINPEKVLVIGDGRSEIEAGKKMNAVTISILPKDAERQREIHKALKTNIIISDYTAGGLTEMFAKN